MFADPTRVRFRPEYLEMLRRCYHEELTTFKEVNKLPAPLFRIVLVRFIIAEKLVQHRSELHLPDGTNVPLGIQVKIIADTLRECIKRGEL